jgi:hypothetical protein
MRRIAATADIDAATVDGTRSRRSVAFWRTAVASSAGSVENRSSSIALIDWSLGEQLFTST